eukprot:363717-Chlamydomonas_euryale.AAC.11
MQQRRVRAPAAVLLVSTWFRGCPLDSAGVYLVPRVTAWCRGCLLVCRAMPPLCACCSLHSGPIYSPFQVMSWACNRGIGGPSACQLDNSRQCSAYHACRHRHVADGCANRACMHAVKRPIV